MQRYRHSQEQRDNLLADIQIVAQRLMAVAFDSPASDEQNIRHHAYLRGKFDLLKDLLEDNYPEPEQVQPTEDL